LLQNHTYIQVSDPDPKTGLRTNTYSWRFKALEDILGITVTGTGNDTKSESKNFEAEINNGVCYINLPSKIPKGNPRTEYLGIESFPYYLSYSLSNVEVFQSSDQNSYILMFDERDPKQV
jgi:hypothetical protein